MRKFKSSRHTGNSPYASSSSSSSPYTRRLLHHLPRNSSPPASTYFSPPVRDDQMEMLPTPGAHFAYSATLRGSMQRLSRLSRDSLRRDRSGSSWPLR